MLYLKKSPGVQWKISGNGKLKSANRQLWRNCISLAFFLPKFTPTKSLWGEHCIRALKT